MRQIKFRGKSSIRGWVYGDLTGENTIHIDNTIHHEDGSCEWYGIEVREETVGQFTGLFDKNGKEIYEGDILKIDETKYTQECTGIVAYSERTAAFRFIPDGMDEYFGGACDIKRREVIGNIHDNPVLIKIID
jgi:uncharacterized phage protein (TIGR01671 family)